MRQVPPPGLPLRPVPAGGRRSQTLPALAAELAGSRGGEVLCTAHGLRRRRPHARPARRTSPSSGDRSRSLAEHGVDALASSRATTRIPRPNKTTRALHQHPAPTPPATHRLRASPSQPLVDEYGHRTITLADPHTLRHAGRRRRPAPPPRRRARIARRSWPCSPKPTSPSPNRPTRSGPSRQRLCHRTRAAVGRAAAGPLPKSQTSTRPVRTRGVPSSDTGDPGSSRYAADRDLQHGHRAPVGRGRALGQAAAATYAARLGLSGLLDSPARGTMAAPP